MIILSDCLSDEADEGCIKAASSLTHQLKACFPDTVTLTYGTRRAQSDLHLKLNPLLLNRRLFSFLRRSREPVLYIPFSSNTKAGVLRAFILSKCSGCQVNVLFALRWPMGGVTRFLLRHSGVNVFSLSEDSHAVYRSIVGERAVRLKAGVDTRRFVPADAERKAFLRQKYAVLPGKKVLLHVGHMRQGRNLHRLLEIGSDYHIFLVVSTHARSRHDRALRRALEQRENITVIDTYLPQIHELYQMADVYFFPVLKPGNCIDVPLSVLEAAACNVPVVTTRYGALRDFSGKEGFYFIEDFAPEELNLLLERAAADKSDIRRSVTAYGWDQAALQLMSRVSQKQRTKVLHLLVSGGTGGIETLMKHLAAYSSNENCFAFLWVGGEVARQMAQSGANVKVFSLKKDGPVKLLRQLMALCKRERFQVVMAHHSAPLIKVVLLVLKARFPKIRAIAYAHANASDICDDTRKKGLWLRTAIHKAAYRRADGVVAISESVKRSLIDAMDIPADKIQVIYNGAVIPEKPPRREKFGAKLIYVGRLVPEKGVQVTLQALAYLPEATFDIVGDGPYRKALEQLARELNIEKRVRFLGTRSDAAKRLSEADIFVHCPTWEEGFGLAVLEAMAAGCVCVCARSGAIPEILEDGISGFLVKKNDPEALARTLGRVLRQNKKDGCAEMRSRAFARARQFSAARFSDELDAYVRREKDECADTQLRVSHGTAADDVQDTYIGSIHHALP